MIMSCVFYWVNYEFNISEYNTHINIRNNTVNIFTKKITVNKDNR